MNVKFKKWNCTVKKAQYQNGRIALSLIQDGEPIAHATSNLSDLGADEVAIKDYSENEGMLNALVSAGIVSEPVRVVYQGWVEFPICKFLGE